MKLIYKEIAAERGKRLKIACNLTGLNSIRFCSQNGLMYHTYKAWEKGMTLLKESEAISICWMLRKYNIICIKEWLLSGVGSYPSVISHYSTNQIDSQVNCHKLISSEIDEFLLNTPNSFIYPIDNNEVGPFYNLGDYLGCTKILLPQEELNLISNCLIKTNDTDIIEFKKIGCVDDYIVIMPTKIGSICQVLPIDSTFVLIAKIVWHRQPVYPNL